MFPNTKKTFSYLRWAVFALTLYFIFYLLYRVFSGSLILSQFFSLGFLNIRFYGIFIALAAAAGFYLALARAEKFGIEKKQAEDILFWTIIAGFIGARIYHIFSSWQFYLNHPADILKVWNGGLSIYGAVFGGVLSLVLCRKLFTFHFPLFTLFNWLTPSLIVGQIIGRFGNFFNYELFGYPTTLPWGMFVPRHFRPVGFADQVFFHPLFLYEQLGLVVILFFIFYLEKKATSAGTNTRSVALSQPGASPADFFKGNNEVFIKTVDVSQNINMQNNAQKSSWASLFLSYLLLYNILRFGLEFLRIDTVYLGNIRQNALVSLVLAVVSLLLIYSSLSAKQSFREINGQ